MLEGRIAIVTGGLQGIGLAIAVELAQQGAHVAIGSRRGDDVESSADARQAVGRKSLIATLDVSLTESVEAFVDKVKDSLGRPDILINCAGISTHETVCGHSDEDWDRVIDINLSGPFRMIRACLPAMKEGGWGRIVNIASTAARTAKETHPAYCASKSGLVGMTRAVALEGGPYGVTCNAISPGWVETEMLRKSALIMANKSGRSQAEEIAAMAAANPQNRLIQPEEIAALAVFCCSDKVPGLTMEDIQINAGAFW